MKVCITALAESGGMMDYSISLANALSKYCDVTVIAFKEARSLLQYAQNLRLIGWEKVSKYRILPSSFRLYKLIKDLKVDVIHDPIGTGNYRSLLARVMLRNIPQVVTIHDVEMHLALSSLRRKLHKLATKITINISDGFCVHGPIAKQKLCQQGVAEEEVVVLPHGCYTIFGETQEPPKQGAYNVLFFGELRYNKGIDRLPKIAKIVNSVIPESRFIVAGSSSVIPQHRAYEASKIKIALEEMKKTTYFEIVDKYIHREEVKKYFTQANVVLLPYYEATQSGIVGIAYAFSRPVVITNVGDLNEMVEHGVTGFIANSTSDEQIAQYIIHLLSDFELQVKMGKEGHKRYKTNYSWDYVAQQLVKFYKDTLSN